MIDLKSISISSQIVQQSLGALGDALIGEVKRLPSSIVEQIQNIRENARFVKEKPDILFISDYIVDDEFIGILIVFEKYLNATHYEIFKKNKFDNEPKFERILFLDSVALTQETKKFLPFLESAGFNLDENSVFVILDDNIKKDRIYEFFVRSGRVPQRVTELNFELIMNSKNMINTLTPSVNSTIKTISASLFGIPDLSWIVPLLNDSVPFFGGDYFFSGGQQIIVPKDTKQFMKIVNDSVYLFGAKITLCHLLNVLGIKGRVNEEIFQAFSDSIDESNGIFSFDFFTTSLLKNSKSFKALDDGGSGLTKKTGTLSFGSLENLSQIFYYIQILDFSILKSQEVQETPAPPASGDSGLSEEQATRELNAITGIAGGVSEEQAARDLKAIT